MHLQPFNGKAHHPELAGHDLEALQVRAFGLLQVAVVAARQGADNALYAAGKPRHGGRPRPHQFQAVGIALVRHDAAAGAQLHRQGHVAQLGQREQHQILGQTAQRHCHLVEGVERDRLQLAAAVGRRQHVVHRPVAAEQGCHLFAVERQRRAVSRRRPERRSIGQPVTGFQQGEIVEQFLGKRRRPQAERRRHGDLHMGAARHAAPLVSGGEIEQGIGQVERQTLQRHQRVAPVQAQRGHHLVVARPAGMDARPGGGVPGKEALQGGVAILVGALDHEGLLLRLLQRRQQAAAQLLQIAGHDHRNGRQHRRVRQRGDAIRRHQCTVELVVVADRESLEQRIQRFALVPELAAGPASHTPVPGFPRPPG